MMNDENNQAGLENPGSSRRDFSTQSSTLVVTPPAAVMTADKGLAVSQLAGIFKVLGHPLRIQIAMILTNERVASIPTLQQYLPGIDPFVLYSNLRLMHKKHLVKKLQKGREVYYALSETAVRMGLDAFFQSQATLNLLGGENPLGRIREDSASSERLVFA